MFYLYTPRKRQETFGFMTFSGDIEMKHWVKIDLKQVWQIFINSETFETNLRIY